MTPKRACLACRARKAKCTPATPRCLRCAELGIDECLYVSVKKRGIGSTLRMGEACQRCRKRKRRCDAKHPCTPCIKLDGGSDCVYEQNPATKRTREKLPTAIQPFLFSFESEPSPCVPPSWVNSKGVSPLTSDIIPSDIGGPAFSSTVTNPSHVSPEQSPSPESYTTDESDPPIPQEKPNPETQLVPFRKKYTKSREPQSTTISAFSFLPSLRFPSIPRQIHIPLSFLGSENIQVSDATSSGLEFSFRLAALQRLRYFGIYLTGPKQNAVMRGDTSNSIVHPFFIPATAGLGMHFCAKARDLLTTTTVRLRAKYGQLAFERVADISQEGDANLAAQVSLYFAVAGLHGMTFKFSREYLKRACIALNAANLRFIPATGRPPELTEDVYEKLTILSQIIYFENYMFLAVDLKEPEMTIRIEKEFRYELQETYPRLFEICPLTMRTQGILLVRDAISLIALYPVDGAKSSQWKQTCHELVTRLDKYSNALLRNIRWFEDIGDSLGTEIIQSSCVGCLAHLAVLCDLVGRLEPNSRPQTDAVCDSSLERLGRLTRGMNFDGYTSLDILLRISWERSLAVFDLRIGCLSHEESASLRYFQQIVTDAWLDIEARLPEQSLPALSALLVHSDGREHGSMYPNFMLTSERRSYGLAA